MDVKLADALRQFPAREMHPVPLRVIFAMIPIFAIIANLPRLYISEAQHHVMLYSQYVAVFVCALVWFSPVENWVVDLVSIWVGFYFSVAAFPFACLLATSTITAEFGSNELNAMLDLARQIVCLMLFVFPPILGFVVTKTYLIIVGRPSRGVELLKLLVE
jgi:hypothetical protein